MRFKFHLGEFFYFGVLQNGYNNELHFEKRHFLKVIDMPSLWL